MDAASSAIAFAQAAGICIKLARALIRKYEAYKYANGQISELVLKIEGIWIKTESQIQFLDNIKDNIDDRLRVFQEECLQRLQTKLCLASVEIEALTGSTFDSISIEKLSLNLKPVRKAKYSILEKHLRKTVDDLESWHATFEPSWFLIGRIADSNLDRALTGQASKDANRDEFSSIRAIRQAIIDTKSARGSPDSIFRDRTFLSPDQLPIPNSCLTLSSSPDAGSGVLLDMTAFDADVDKLKYVAHVRDLARLLSLSQPTTLGLLQCLGVVKILDLYGNVLQFQFIFKIPSPLHSPTALRTLLMGPSPSLDARYRLAKSLARGVMAVHSADFVHKNIRPETTVVFEDDTNPLPVSFLVGFERFRPAAAGTNLTGDMVWERNIYRYPARQGIKPEHAYMMQHDIYSLGVCLLEIGIWTSFVTLSNPPQPGPLLHISKQLAMKETLQAAWDIKKIFIEMANEALPSKMGLVYTDVVLSCLTCLDSGAANLFGDAKDLYDQDGILVGLAFIEKILVQLESICI